MSKESTLIFLGIFVIIIPFLGFPDQIRTIFFVVAGILISFLSLLIYARERLLGEKKTAAKKRPTAPPRSVKKISANAVSENIDNQGVLEA